MPKTGISRFYIENLLFHSTAKFRRGNFLCFWYQKISGIEKFYKRRGREGVSRFSVKKFLSHSTENFPWGNQLVTHENFPCVTNFVYRKILCLRGLCYYFLLLFFCLTVPKNFVWESFSVSLISGIEKC